MEVTQSPTLIGAFIFAFLSLAATLVWVVKSLLRHQQNYSDKILPEQMNMFRESIEKINDDANKESKDEREFFAKQLESVQTTFTRHLESVQETFTRQVESIQGTFIQAHREITGQMKTLQESMSSGQRVMERHTDIIAQHAQSLDGIHDVIREAGLAPRAPRPA